MRNVDYINLDQSTVEEMPNGFLTLLANLSRTGIFTYQRIAPDGSIEIIRQLRTSEEVFDPESLASLTGLPLTNTHPEEMISPENASDFIVGMASDTPKKVFAPVQNTDSDDKEEFIQQKLTVFDEDTIAEILRKEKGEISLGYTCQLEDSPGMYKGQPYDVIQRNIRMNHVSLVRNARGGRNCKILLDGAETVVNYDGITGLEDDNFKESKDVKVFKHDGKEFKVEDNVYSLLTSLQADSEDAKDLSSGKQKEIDKLQAVNDDLKSKLEVKNQNDSADKFRQAVKARVSLESQGEKVLGSEVNFDSLSDDEIKLKVIKKLRPSSNLDGKSADYIDARFDMVMEDFKAEDRDDGEEDRKKLGKNIVTNEDGDDPWSLAEKARKKAWERSKELSKRKV
jgi:hypothetical protein